MPVKLVENKGASVMFVGGKMIFPGASELVDVPEDAEPDGAHDVENAGDEDADYDAPLIEMLEQPLAAIVPNLPALTDEALARLEALEAAGKNRKGLLAELKVERLKRAAGGGEAAAGSQEESAEGDKTGGDVAGGAGEGEAG